MREVAETCHLFLDNKFAYSGAGTVNTTFRIDWALLLGDLYKYKRFKICLNAFDGWSDAQSVAGFDQRVSVRLRGLPWCAGNSCGVYNTIPVGGASYNDLSMTYADAEAIVPSFILLPLNGNQIITYSDSNGLCFNKPPPGPTDLNVTFQDCRSNTVYPTYDGKFFYYNMSFTIIPLED